MEVAPSNMNIISISWAVKGVLIDCLIREINTNRDTYGTSEQVMDRHLAAKICRFCVADLRNSPLLRAIHAPKEVPLGCALNRHILIDNLFGPDLF
jgi:hypothetical protein